LERNYALILLAFKCGPRKLSSSHCSRIFVCSCQKNVVLRKA